MPLLPRGLPILLLLAAPLASADLLKLSGSGQTMLSFAPEEQFCAGVLTPLPWRDASDAMAFARGPTARLDSQELWAATAPAPLLAIRYATGGLHLVLVGFPARAQIRFTHAGWRPRWPFC
ncbi:MAG: hypothetical protein ACXWLR_15410 [Myxococcales bacterium]